MDRWQMKRSLKFWGWSVAILAAVATLLWAQLQPSGNNVTVVGPLTITGALPAGNNIIGQVSINQTTPGTTNGVQVNAALPAGTNILGWLRVIPAGCFGQSTPSNVRAAPVLTGGGSTLTPTTSCVLSCFVNNLTNSAVTIRLTDGQGTPVIWVGGNSDYSLTANSNANFPFTDGTIFTSGVIAIAGSANALNINCTVFQ
jgi:hypothetical protein